MICVCFLFASVCVYGGSDRRAQIDTVKSGVQIVIGTYIVEKRTIKSRNWKKPRRNKKKT